MPQAGCSQNNSPIGFTPIDTNAPVKGEKVFSTSNLFINTGSDPIVITKDTLLDQSQQSNNGVHEIDVDVKETDQGVQLIRGGGTDTIDSGGTRSWKGRDDGFGELWSATNFTLTLKPSDHVVISWSEIK